MLENELVKQTSATKKTSDIGQRHVMFAPDPPQGAQNQLQKEFLVRRSDIYESQKMKPVYKSKLHEKIKEDQQMKKEQERIIAQERAALQNKKMNYGKFVKEEYMPPRSQRKIDELNEIRARVASYNKRKPYL